MKKLIRETAEEILQEYTNCYSEADEDCLVRMLEKLASNMAREIFAEIEHTARAAIILLKFEKDEEIHNIKTECYTDLIGYIAELKKKYMGIKEVLPAYMRMEAKALPAILKVKYTEDGE